MNCTELLEVSKLVDATLEKIDVQEMSWKNDEEQITLYRRGPGSEGSGGLVGKLSVRAMGNLSKASKASSALLRAQAEHTLNDLLRTQLLGHKTFNIIHDPTDPTKVASIWPEKLGYRGYGELLAGLDTKVHTVRGDPVNGDGVTVLVNASECKVAGEDWIIGPLMTISSTGMIKSEFQFGGWRVVCTNGLVDSVFADHKLFGIDNSVVNAIARDYAGRGDEYVRHLTGVVEFARATVLDPGPHLELLSGVPGPLMEKLNAIVQEPAVNVKELQDAGVGSRVETLFDAYNVVTHLSKTIQAPMAHSRVESKAFSWMDRVHKVFGGN